jgi:hypothetical protein
MPTRLFLLAVILLSSAVQAHRSHFGWTEVKLNDQTVEIIHRFHEHDAALLVSNLTGEATDITRLESQAKFALYVEQTFSLGSGAQPNPLKLIGAELKNHYLFVYQELPIDELPTSLTIAASPLMDLYPDQIHVVNVELPGIKQTIEFTQDSSPQMLSAE